MNVHAQQLNKVGEYRFPSNAFAVQKHTAALFIENKRAYCLNELGTGKTRSILYAFDALRKFNLAQKMLVICPLSAMARTWRREIMMHLPHLKCAIVHGTREKRNVRLLLDVDVYIINHDGLNVMYDTLVDRNDIDVVCCDEVAVYRNGRSERTKCLRDYVRPKPYVWALTGSPMPRAVTDVWGPCSCLTPWTVPKYFTIFRDQMMTKQDAAGWRWKTKPGAEEKAVSCMQPSVRYRLDEVAELPPRVTNYYEAELTPKQHKVYEGMRQKALALVGEHKVDALNAGAVLSKLLQIAIGYVYTREGRTIHLDNTPTPASLSSTLSTALARRLFYSRRLKSAVAAFDVMLTENKISHAVVTGDTLLNKRNDIFNRFQDTREYHVLLAHPVCMSHSLTLTAASTTIWAGPVTSLETFTQANGRTYRVGQDTKTLVAMVGGTPMEKKIYKLLGANEKLQNRFLEIVEAITEDNSDE